MEAYVYRWVTRLYANSSSCSAPPFFLFWYYDTLLPVVHVGPVTGYHSAVYIYGDRLCPVAEGVAF